MKRVIWFSLSAVIVAAVSAQSSIQLTANSDTETKSLAPSADNAVTLEEALKRTL